MTTTDPALQAVIDADYSLRSDGGCELNESGARLADLRRQVDDLVLAVDRSFVGTGWAGLFVKCEWLARLKVCLSWSYEYDDEGGCYRSFRSDVQGLEFVSGASVPALICRNGQPDEELARAWLEEDVQELEERTFLCMEQLVSGREHVELDLQRHRIAALLANLPVSGQLAYAALFVGEAIDFGD